MLVAVGAMKANFLSVYGNSYLSQLVPVFGQLVPVFWSTRTSQVNLYLVWSTCTLFGQLIPLKKEIVDGQRSGWTEEWIDR